MNISLLQYILAGVSLFFIGNRIVRFVRKEKTQTIFKLMTTIVVWGGIFFTSLFPKTVHDISRGIGLGENLNTLIFIGFVVVFFILFKLLASVENLERQITELVRKEALSLIKKLSD